MISYRQCEKIDHMDSESHENQLMLHQLCFPHDYLISAFLELIFTLKAKQVNKYSPTRYKEAEMNSDCWTNVLNMEYKNSF